MSCLCCCEDKAENEAPGKSIANCFNCCGGKDVAETEMAVVNNPVNDAPGTSRQGAQTVIIRPIQAPQIPVGELEDITGNFGPSSLIAEGHHGMIHFGVLSTGESAAIKKLYPTNQTREEFLAQVSMVSNVKHPNFLQLLGYFVDERSRILAYEFAPNGSLHDILHGKKGVRGAQPGPVLTWEQRIKIAFEAAKGLEHLHKKADPNIIHRNITSCNILIFDDYEAKIADIDLSNQDPSTVARLNSSTLLGDKIGYFAPEYTMSGIMNTRCDVYSFGVVLLELLTGKRAVDSTLPRGQQNLVSWASPNLGHDRVVLVVDERLENDYRPNGVAKLAAIAALCVQFDATIRPSMTIIMNSLERLLRRSRRPAAQTP
ncbi:pto-interacting protein 1-like isoform X2 [Cicer arietinum]|uniref:Pto-interacting protein 1-like n=1 Tax=Cicer arietinum TaxID=3827 RepID=A0A1S2XTW0_CICAR|nr:pto-interacting protein 1-like [Cicer arietinum]